MNKQIFRTGALVVLASFLAVLMACTPKAEPRVTVKTGTGRTGTITRNVEFSGVFAPNQTLNIFAKLAGVATTVKGDVGSRVRKGQLLVQIDTKELNAQLKVAEAAGAGVSDQAAQAKIGVDTARLNLEMAQRSYDRTKTLLDSKVVTESQLDDAQTKLDLASSAFENASHQLRTVSGSGLAQAEAQANFIRVQISNSTIVSPLDGIVTNRNINPGEITSMSMPLMTIADTATLKLQGNVSQEDVVRLSVGDKVKVAVDAMAGKDYAGRIDQVGPIAAATGQYFPIIVKIANDGKLMAGMTAKTSLTMTGASGLIIPLPSVGEGEDGQAYVFVVVNRKIHKRPVTLGMRNGGEVQVLSGLTSGDTIALSNVAALQEDMEVAQ